MPLALDFRIFGNGHGMKSPYWDDVFYWLVDTRDGGRTNGRGALYSWFPGLGAQLTSRQWTMPRPGERRRLAGHDFVVFQARRKGFRVEVSWALARIPDKLDDANAKIRSVKADLDRCDPGV